MDINDVIRAVLEGSPAPSAPAASAPPRVISHQKQPTTPSQPTQTQPQSGGDILTNILSGVLNGRHQPTAGATTVTAGIPWGDILGTMMGAGLGSVAANTVLAPIIDQLAQRFNIPPRVAQMIVAFALAQLVQSHIQGGTGRTARGSFQTQQLLSHISSQDGVSQQLLHNA